MPPGPPLRLCHGPIGGVTAAPKPPAENGVPKKTLDTSLDVKKYGEEVPPILRQNFYVDDMLKSFPSAKIAADMIQVK